MQASALQHPPPLASAMDPFSLRASVRRELGNNGSRLARPWEEASFIHSGKTWQVWSIFKFHFRFAAYALAIRKLRQYGHTYTIFVFRI